MHNNLPDAALIYPTASYPPEDIICIGKDQQSEDDHHAHDLCIFHELLTGLAPGYHFIQQEHHMSAIECRNGQYIHKGQDKRKESRDLPE